MARPKGYRLNAKAFHDLLRAKRIEGMTAAGALCNPPMALSTISDLVNGNTGATIKTAERLAAGLDCDVETLFPELGRWMLRPVMEGTAA